MTKKRTIDPAMIDTVAQNMFHILPLIKKRLLHMDLVQREHGTPLSHVQVLAMLQDAGTMSVSEISRRLGIAKPNITPLVDRLFEAGYVDRQHDENDRRVVNIVLLPAGEEKLAAIRATIARQIQVQAEGLSVSEFRELNDSLANVVRILSSL
ncbi:MAG: MarR family winged helix-turn-helix transcriptional regulator [Candidatus Ventricola sp.]